jgi:hypothetical protein
MDPRRTSVQWHPPLHPSGHDHLQGGAHRAVALSSPHHGRDGVPSSDGERRTDRARGSPRRLAFATCSAHWRPHHTDPLSRRVREGCCAALVLGPKVVGREATCIGDGTGHGKVPGCLDPDLRERGARRLVFSPRRRSAPRGMHLEGARSTNALAQDPRGSAQDRRRRQRAWGMRDLVTPRCQILLTRAPFRLHVQYMRAGHSARAPKLCCAHATLCDRARPSVAAPRVIK